MSYYINTSEELLTSLPDALIDYTTGKDYFTNNATAPGKTAQLELLASY